MYVYISEKARLFLKMKPEIYRKNDALGLPDPDLTIEELNLLKTGCQQIREGKWETTENPLTNIGIHGFSILMELFHFERVDKVFIFPRRKDSLTRRNVFILLQAKS